MSDLRIAAIRLACRDVAATIGFYMAAFGCRWIAAENQTRALLLGDQQLQFALAMSDSWPAPHANAVAFQHCAIIVSDMDEAMRHLHGVANWTAISLNGPERLPDASGGATAFKFRDPDGHPLELLAFPPDKVPAAWRKGNRGPFLGIDHTAITVSDTDRAVAFWSSLGFKMTERHTNRGAEQARLDGLSGPDAIVEVTTLMPAGGAPPHLELLRYVTPPSTAGRTADGSLFATSLIFHGAPSGNGADVDPDGHRVRFQGA